MKKLRSLIAVLLGVALLAAPVSAATASTKTVASSASGSATDAYKLYEKTMKKLDAATSLEMTGTMKIAMNMGSTSIETQGTTTTRQIMKDDKLQMEVIVAMDDLGISTTSYYKDGYYYTKSGDSKTKTKMSLTDAKSSAREFDLALTKDLMKNATVEEVSGGTRIKCAISAKEANALIGEAMDELLDEDAGVKLGKISYSMLIGDNGLPKSMGIVMNITMDMDGVDISAKLTMTYKIKSVNKLTKIDFPTDLKSYKAA